MKLGRYQVVSKLATGGMAEVYLAKAAGPGGFEKSVVVKRILPHLAAEPRFVEMFLSEARLAARMDHPNIVQIFDFGEQDGTWFLAMEFIDGLNLRVLNKKARAAGIQLPVVSCARIISSACEGLSYAHERTDPATGEPLGLIHRDISPDNILVSRQGAVKVVDFGIAKAAGHGPRTQTGTVKGKLAYMPPEQLRAMPLDRRVDVYALGVVLYELLTGHRPFEANNEAALARAILYEQPIPAAKYRPELPPELLRIVERAMAKERKQRHPDCRALQAELERFIVSTEEPQGTWQLSRLVAHVTECTEASTTIFERVPKELVPVAPRPPPKGRPTPKPSLASPEPGLVTPEPTVPAVMQTRAERKPEPRRPTPARTPARAVRVLEPQPPQPQESPRAEGPRPRARPRHRHLMMGAVVTLLLVLAAGVSLLLAR